MAKSPEAESDCEQGDIVLLRCCFKLDSLGWQKCFFQKGIPQQAIIWDSWSHQQRLEPDPDHSSGAVRTHKGLELNPGCFSA